MHARCRSVAVFLPELITAAQFFKVLNVLREKSGLLGYNFCTFIHTMAVIGSPSVLPSRTLSPSSNTDGEISVAEMKSCESMHSS